MNAREEVLARIAAAYRAAPPAELSYSDITREYRTTSDLQAAALIELLIDRLVDYRALVRQCGADDLGAEIATALSNRSAQTVVAPTGLDPSWTRGFSGSVLTDGVSTDDQLSVLELDGVDGVITSCAVAIAETGTLILDGSPGQGRRVITLIPDYHLCVVFADQIVADVPDALVRLEATRPLTMISGPSATSDIELNRVEGVHGPRTLEVIIVDPSTATGSEERSA
ncbi:MAG TPA: LUD domain-containing protein [Propionibacteriaceae bacterium]|nr:LUD domain-containing protein [Propionibacteriaceae bacterium]